MTHSPLPHHHNQQEQQQLRQHRPVLHAWWVKQGTQKSYQGKTPTLHFFSPTLFGPQMLDPSTVQLSQKLNHVSFLKGGDIHTSIQADSTLPTWALASNSRSQLSASFKRAIAAATFTTRRTRTYMWGSWTKTVTRQTCSATYIITTSPHKPITPPTTNLHFFAWLLSVSTFICCAVDQPTVDNSTNRQG